MLITNTPPCILFSQLDVTSPLEVAKFAEFLYDTLPPFEEPPRPPRDPDESFDAALKRIEAGEDSYYEQRDRVEESL